MDKKVVIIGAGPTGLGAATRLQQLGHKDWTLIEKSKGPGGLSSSIVDNKGFTWDIGVHVIFSHYQYFDDVITAGMDSFGKKKLHPKISQEDLTNSNNLWCFHRRESWIRFNPKVWIQYPFQNHFHLLDDQNIIKDCINGIIDLNKVVSNTRVKPASFQEWINQSFGSGLAKHFMNPYNFKVWGFRPHEMCADWVGERVATVNLSAVVDNIIENYNKPENLNKIAKDANWGPNSHFKYPKYGGIGAIWRGVHSLLDENHIKLDTEVEEIDAEQKILKFKNSNSIKYDYLISTMPLDKLLYEKIKPTNTFEQNEVTNNLTKPIHSTTHVIGLGFSGQVPKDLADKSWLYLQSNQSPFYRATILSNYSPYMVNEPNKEWSLLFEVCETENRPVNRSEIINDVIQGALNENLFTDEHAENIISKWNFCTEYGYPTPYLKRNEFLDYYEPILRKKHQIYSRGRFGGWKYEVSNQDHSLMQGVESVDNILFGCEEQTYFYPDHVNSRKETTRRFLGF